MNDEQSKYSKSTEVRTLSNKMKSISFHKKEVRKWKQAGVLEYLQSIKESGSLSEEGSNGSSQQYNKNQTTRFVKKESKTS
ncbi:hypothetical protein Glove_541g69 [Diversispora epigaea]|uniref:Uncharacterized protein n=1 Tax=Diversispora epigaea TaxID=1348612 RepID=A0A397GEG3_9GLOM|nr:hypothetical protein Glove_541g69 [Diversispora epigaea]